LSARYVELLPALAAAFLLSGCAAGPARAPEPERPVARADSRAVRNADGDRANVPEGALAAHTAAIDAMRRGDDAAALAELERLIASYPELPGPYVNLAIVHRRAGRDDDALASLERALALDPGHPEANNELGILLRERGEFDAAEAAYRRALERRPDYALALYNLGVLLDVYLRRPAEALECYEAYLAAIPEPDERVSRWIVDLRRRIGAEDAAARVARGE